jgi:chorismate--pyruvate lyase
MERWLSALTCANPYAHWLALPGSLTHALMSRCPAFRVLRLRQATARPALDEFGVLGLRPGCLAMVREVQLSCGETPLVFAHTVIPLTGLRGTWRDLASLGNRPLGATLFTDPRVARGPLTYRHLDRRHPLYHAACLRLADPPPRLWARRSLFRRARRPILVTEIFLPEILKLP